MTELRADHDVVVGEIVPAGRPAGEVAVWAGQPARVADAVRGWLVAHAGRSRDTWATYTTAMRLWLDHCGLFDVDPLQPAKADLDLWQRVLEQTPSTRYKTKTTPASGTVATRFNAIASFYAYLVDEDIIDKSPVRRRTRPKASTSSTTVGMSAAEQAQVEARLALESTLDRAVVLTLLLQGLRVSELLGMTVDRALRYKEGRPTIQVVGKGSRTREIVADERVREVLAALVAERHGENPPPDVLVFLRPDGSALSRFGVVNRVKRICRAAGVQSWARLSPHSLRHTSITQMLSSGTPLSDVQVFHGHASPTTTVRYDREAGAVARAARAVDRRAEYIADQTEARRRAEADVHSRLH